MNKNAKIPADAELVYHIGNTATCSDWMNKYMADFYRMNNGTVLIHGEGGPRTWFGSIESEGSLGYGEHLYVFRPSDRDRLLRMLDDLFCYRDDEYDAVCDKLGI